MSYRSAVRSPPWADSSLVAAGEDISKRKSYYVRSGSAPSGTDVKLYDTANVFVCTQGQANTNAIGELYVDYEVILMTPQLTDVGTGEAIYGVYAGTSNAAPKRS